MKKVVVLSLLASLLVGSLFANGQGEAAGATFKGKNVRKNRLEMPQNMVGKA